uniref:Uncharacterized protein n=1 Tax=Arundo donax TaxID=35708 RepID=A0A0A9BG82_ARUDO
MGQDDKFGGGSKSSTKCSLGFWSNS